MAVFTYIARRSLGASHVLNETYDIEIRLVSCDEDEEIKADDQYSLNGACESQYFGSKRIWVCTTRPIEFGQQQYVLEFLDSVKDRQIIAADLHGSLARPDTTISVRRIDTSSPRQRSARLGNGGRDDYRSYKFTLREV